MSIDWSKLLTKAQMECLAAEEAELERLYGLPDREIGEELLTLARKAREENPRLLGDPDGISYSPALVWHVIPEVAKRLGCAVGANEASSDDIVGISDRDLREAVGHYLANATLNYGLELQDLERPGNQPRAIDLLDREACNGNPVAIAIDRICPPAPEGQDQDDQLARRIREVGRYVDGAQVAMWSPEAASKSEIDAKLEPTGLAGMAR
jgi:hypothetical protein